MIFHTAENCCRPQSSASAARCIMSKAYCGMLMRINTHALDPKPAITLHYFC